MFVLYELNTFYLNQQRKERESIHETFESSTPESCWPFANPATLYSYDTEQRYSHFNVEICFTAPYLYTYIKFYYKFRLLFLLANINTFLQPKYYLKPKVFKLQIIHVLRKNFQWQSYFYIYKWKFTPTTQILSNLYKISKLISIYTISFCLSVSLFCSWIWRFEIC